MSSLIYGLFARSLRYAKKIILTNINYVTPVIFFACLDLERKFS